MLGGSTWESPPAARGERSGQRGTSGGGDFKREIEIEAEVAALRERVTQFARRFPMP